MCKQKQEQEFADRLDKFIESFCDEFDLSYASICGILHAKIYLLFKEMEEEPDDKTS